MSGLRSLLDDLDKRLNKFSQGNTGVSRPQAVSSLNQQRRIVGNVASGIGRDMAYGLKSVPRNVQLMKKQPEQFSKGVGLATDYSKVGRLATKGAEGIFEGMGYGLGDIPVRKSENGLEKLAYAGGFLAGSVASPITKGAQLLSKTAAIKPAQQTLGREAGKLIAKGGAYKLAGRGVANLSQGLPYGVAYQASRPIFGQKPTAKGLAGDTAIDLAMGSVPVVGGLLIGSKGAIKGSGKAIGQKAGDFAGTLDKQARREISDYMSKIKPTEWKNIQTAFKTMPDFPQYTTLGDLFSHKPLFKSYPEFQNLRVEFDPKYKATGTQGSFDPSTFTIKLNPTIAKADEARSTLLHEIQHAIQQVEGFSKGGSPNQLRLSPQEKAQLEVVFEEQWKGLQKMSPSDPNYREAFQYLQDISKQLDAPDKKYSRLLGELESRAVQNRANLTNLERTNTDPYTQTLQKEGLATSDLIAKFDGTESLSKADVPTPLLEAPRLRLPEPTLTAKTPFEAKSMKKKYGVVPEFAFEKAYKRVIRMPGNVERNTATGNPARLRDISNYSKGLTDVYNNFRQVFSDRFPDAKKRYLDPFDDSKGAKVGMEKQYLDDLETNIIKKLGIKPRSRESALVQQFGEGKISIEELQRMRPKDWQKIVEADGWFRNKYDELLETVNASRRKIYGEKGVIPRRNDYYRHFREMKEGIAGLLNVFDTPANISPELAGLSQFTKPKSKWLSFAQQRIGDKSDIDAVGGFLDYIRKASYSTHIDPHIQNFRGLQRELIEATSDVKDPTTYAKLNNFIEFLEDYSNLLAGKTNPYDRPLQKILGRKAFRSIDWLNSRVKANMIVGNISSTIAQFFNIPQGVADAGVKNYTKGNVRVIADVLGDHKLSKAMQQSNFISERYASSMYNKFDTGLLKQPKRFAVWVTGIGDEIGTKSIWNAYYEKALAQGVPNPVRYADNLTREMVAGRGIGEVPILQSAKTMQFIAPFQLEVANSWRVMNRWVTQKEFGKLMTFFLASYIMNEGARRIRGSDVTFDPINASIEAYEAYAEEEDKGMGALKAVGRGTGEVLSNLPIVGQAAAIYPEYGFKVGDTQLPTREDFFGEGDPTRYGTGLLVTKGLSDPLAKIIPPFGGQQIKRSIQGATAYAKGYSESKGGRVQYPIEQNVRNLGQSVLFGKYSVPEAREYFDSGTTALGDKQSELFKGAGDKKAVYDQIMTDRKANAQLDAVKAKVEKTGTGQVSGNSVVYYEDGEVKTIDMNKPLKTPKLTGNNLLDKEQWSDYKSSITSKKNDVVELWRLGVIDTQQAIAQLGQLELLKKQAGSSSGSKKGKKAKTTDIASIVGQTFNSKKLPKQQMAKLNLRTDDVLSAYRTKRQTKKPDLSVPKL